MLCATSSGQAILMDSQLPFSIPRRELTGRISVFDGRSLTRIPFTQLLDDVVRKRTRLAEAGLCPGMCVGIIGENCYEWIVHDLAVLSLGCIAVCFPADEFASEKAENLADTYDLSLLLVTKKVGMRQDLSWVVMMNTESPSNPSVRSVEHTRSLRQRLFGTDVCTVIFSSGTSGQLKALLLSRAGVDATIDALANDWDMNSEDGILVALPLSIFQQRLMVYAALRKNTEILLTDSANLFRSFKVLRPTIVLGPPALFESIENRFHAMPFVQRQILRFGNAALAVIPWKRQKHRLRRRLFHKTYEALGGQARVLLTGSAPSKPSTLRFFESSGLSLFQAYGLAEVGFIAWNRPGHNRRLSVGRPVFPGSVSIAEDGEIIVSVRHPQALGYFRIDPTDEARTFLSDGRIATGDLGRFDRDGYLYITGRKKNLIVLPSGEKVNPESLELQLGAPPGVDRVVVIGGGQMATLVAVFAIAAECNTEEEVRIRSQVQSAIDHLNERVKPASRIARFIITRVPFRPETGLVTRNLKLDRGAVYRFFERDLTRDAPRSAKVYPA